MRKYLVVAGILFVLLIGWYLWRYGTPSFSTSNTREGPVDLAQRSQIDPSKFTRTDTHAALTILENSASSTFSEERRETFTPVTLSALPEAGKRFIAPGPGEPIELKRAVGGKAYYTAHYFSELALPESYLRFLRLALPPDFERLFGMRNELAAIIVLESTGHFIKITQLAVSEGRTEVTVYIKSK